MKIVLAFEHIRRLPGARSQIVVELATRLQNRGHDVSIVCDTVTDPDLYPELQFVARRAFQSGQSHRLLLLHNWSKQVIREISPDISISFFPAIPADIIIPVFGWVQTMLARERRYCSNVPNWCWNYIHPKTNERRYVEWLSRKNPMVIKFAALSKPMAKAMLEVDRSIKKRLLIIPGASPIEPDTRNNGSRISNDNKTTRQLLQFKQDDIIFIWEATIPLWHGRNLLLNAFQEIIASGVKNAKLILASEGQWNIHDQSVDRNCDEHVRIIGRTADMHSLLATCNVGVMPAIHSTLGRFVWECLAFGKPVIASSVTAGTDRLNAYRNQSLHGTAGKIIETNNHKQLVTAMLEMLDEKVRVKATQQAQLIAPEMSFNLFVDRIESLLNTLVNK